MPTSTLVLFGMRADASAFSAGSPAGFRGTCRRTVFEGTSHTFWRLGIRPYEEAPNWLTQRISSWNTEVFTS